jgi:hypothetical protein
VGHVKYDIQTEPGLTAITGTSGTCGQDVQRVLIDDQLGKDQERETVLHELMHAIFYATGTHHYLEAIEKDTDYKELEEKVIQPVSARVLELLRDNPKLVAYLLEG